MQRQYFRFDKDGYLTEPVIASEVWDDDNPIPDDLTDVRPPDGLWRARFVEGAWVEAGEPPKPCGEVLAVQMRARRDELLKGTDWTQLVDAPIAYKEKKAMCRYRQALRDVPQQSGFPFEVAWPDEKG